MPFLEACCVHSGQILEVMEGSTDAHSGTHEIGIVRADLGRPSEFIVLLCLFALWLLPGLKVRPAVTTIPRDSSSQTMRLSRLARTVAGI